MGRVPPTTLQFTHTFRNNDESDDERSERHIRSEYMGDEDYRERSHYEKDRTGKKGKEEKSLRKRIKDRINAVIHRKELKQQQLQAEEEESRQAASNRIMDFYVTYSDWDALKKAVTEDFDEEMTTMGQDKRDKRARKNPLCETTELARRIDFARSLYESKVKEKAVREEAERKEREEAEQKEREREERQMETERKREELMKKEKKRAERERAYMELLLREKHFRTYTTETEVISPEKRLSYVDWCKREQQRHFRNEYKKQWDKVDARRKRCNVEWADVRFDAAAAVRIKQRFKAARNFTFGRWLMEWRKMVEEAEHKEDEMEMLDELKSIMNLVKQAYEEWRWEHVADEDYTQNQWEKSAHPDLPLENIARAYEMWQ